MNVVKEQGNLEDHGDHKVHAELMTVESQKVTEIDPADLRHDQGTALICLDEVDDSGSVVLVVEKQKLLELISEESFAHAQLGGIGVVVHDPLHYVLRAGPVGLYAVDFAAAALCQRFDDLIESVKGMVGENIVGRGNINTAGFSLSCGNCGTDPRAGLRRAVILGGTVFIGGAVCGKVRIGFGSADAVRNTLDKHKKAVIEGIFFVEVDVLEPAQHELETPGEAYGLEKDGHHFFGVFVGVGDLVLNVMGLKRGLR